MVIIDILLILAAIVITVILLRKQVNLGYVMLIDTVFLAFLSKTPALSALKYAYNGVISGDCIQTILLLFLIMMIENIMRNSGMILTMIDNLNEIVGSKRAAAGLLPTMLGLLPSPGGARFSCPMVSELTKESPDELNKAYINYWFRHIWMDGFILYPGIILASRLLKVSVIDMFIHLIPFMLINVMSGYFFGLRHLKKEKIEKTKPLYQSLKSFLFAMLPIIMIILIYILFLNVTKFSLEIASSSVLIFLLVTKKYSFKKIIQTAKEAFPIKLVIIIMGVMVFKEVLLESGAISGLPDLLKLYGIPIAVLYVLLPFLGAFTSGMTISYVSLAFPILIPLGLGSNPWFATVAFMAGSIGIMTTPLHLCASITADYFKSSIISLIKKVATSQVIILILLIILLVICV